MVEFRILGALEVSHQGRPVEVGGSRLRALLAHLLLDANRVVSSDRLIDELWGETPPERAGNALQAAVSRLRRALGGDVALLTRPPGYVLEIEKEALDLHRFERLRAEGVAALGTGDPETALARLHEALSLWRGPALADFAYEPFAQGEIARLEALRLGTIEDRIEADLQCGRHGELAGELEALVRDHPLRERFRAQLVLARYRSGRQGEALEAYRAARDALVEELGIEPGPDLRDLHERILHQDPALAPPSARTAVKPVVAPVPATPAHPEPSPPLEVRKTVTVVFCDVADSTGLAERLDPETLRAVMSRYFEVAREAFHRHGGTVEKFIGDAVMAVFGIPALHEDDALRAIRAVTDLTQGLGALNEDLEREGGIRLEVRVGVNTGEVVAGDWSTGQALVTGSPVNTAVRLEQAAARGEILIGEATRKLVRSAITVEPVSQLSLKGVHEAVVAWRLISLVPGAPSFPRRLDAPLVGRVSELAQLHQALDRAVNDRTAVLFTIIGSPGIGKTRLAQEFAASLGDKATVLTGRCLSYGQGITYWPLREIITQLVGENPREGIVHVLGGADRAELVAERIAAAIGAGGEPGGPEETFWAARQLLEGVGRTRPLLLIFEDVHWAEQSLLDLVEDVADYTADAPVLILCLARPELLEARSLWGGGRLNATTILLEPLAPADTQALLGNLVESQSLTTADLARISEAAEGNPLFLEQLVAMVAESGMPSEEAPLPPTVQALLAARFDRLGPAERAVCERAAIVGKEFWSSAVADLLPEEARPSLPQHLRSLTRKQFVKHGGSDFGGGKGYRFRHALIQQAAYRAMPKALRAELHERFADWLEELAGERAPEYEEILGYHLEQAHRYLAELGAPSQRRQELAERAADRLAASGRRAFARGDMPAAVSLLERVRALPSSDDVRSLSVLPPLGRALTEQGRLEQAEVVLSEAIESGRAAGERGVAADAAVALSWVRLHTDPHSTHENARLELKKAIRVFEELHDEGGLARALGLAGILRLWDGQAEAAIEALERAAGHAHAAGDRAQESESLRFLVVAVLHGPVPVASALERLEQVGRRALGHRRLEVTIQQARAHLEAMRGHIDTARKLIAEAESSASEMGLEMDLAARVLRSAGDIELLARDPRAAERALRPACEALERMGAWTHLASVVPCFADALYAQGRGAEALSSIELATRWAVRDDVEAQVGLRRVRAKLLAQQGDFAAAERLAREATELAQAMDLLDESAKAIADLSEVLRLANRPKEATEALEGAIRLYELKGNVVSAERAQALIAELSARPSASH
jgi:class 3 adenylate cyclase/DNA-binding SARP family transcriptional activator/tetratricopeptide (TPR) repeat protein